MKKEKQDFSKQRKNSKFFEEKKKLVKDLINHIKEYDTIMIVSIEGIPSSQLQKIKKEIKDIAILKVCRKKLVEKAFNEACSEKKYITKMLEKNQGNYAVLFSNKDAFEIALILQKNKIFAKARAGQIAPQDIVLEAGPTDLPPPAISEVAKLGVKASIEEGKIFIKETKQLVKKGEKIPETIANTLGALEIAPFSITLKVLAAYDSKSEKVYFNLNVSPEQVLQDLKESSLKAFEFALTINYICKETIKNLLAKAFIHGKILEKFKKVN
ncbi:MAG: 50S ribosomal protein L10 [Candidatus Pacearchaeota archaeon]